MAAGGVGGAAGYGYGYWELTIIYVAVYSLFLLFIPFRKRATRLPSSIYLAFIVALFAEMYGFPLTIYILTWYFGYRNPLTHEAGHLLYPEQGMLSPFHLLSVFMVWGGMILIVEGWRKVHGARDRLVTHGVYRFVRHPQYLGILLLTSGLLVQWITIPTTLMWPVLAILYYRLARKEEKELEDAFGQEYREYRRKTPMFIPIPRSAVNRLVPGGRSGVRQDHSGDGSSQLGSA